MELDWDMYVYVEISIDSISYAEIYSAQNLEKTRYGTGQKRFRLN